MKSELIRAIRMTVGLITIAAATATAEQGKFYVGGDVGAVVTTDTELEQWFDATLAPNSELTFDPGFRLGVRGGYGVTDWFDAEVETGFMVNNIDSATGASESDASLTQVPLLINARFHCPAFHGVSPYFGGGLGMSTTYLWADDLVIDGIALDGTTAGFTFAYQAFAGLRFAINEQMSLSLEYHYFATTGTEMDVDVTSGISSDELEIGSTASHTATIGFYYRF
jgi:opacity protein-like surface antigen